MGNAASSSSSSEGEEEEFQVPSQSVQQQPVPQSQQTQSSQTLTGAKNDDSSVSEQYQKDRRLTAWICLLAASIIAMTSMLGYIGGGWGPQSWVFLVTIVSIAFSFLHLVDLAIRHKFQCWGKTCGEGFAAYTLLIFWIGGLGVVMSPSRALAVTRTDIGLNVVRNANLYFSSWFAFICTFYICASFTMEHWKKAAEIISAVTGRMVKWWILFIVSIIVLVSSTQFHYSQDCPNGGRTDLSVNACASNRYAVALGAFASVLTLIAIILGHIAKLLFYVESVFAVVLFIFYTAGIAVITYNEGSGVTIGNLYFATWTGFILTIFLCINCFHECMKRRAERKAKKPKESKKKSSMFHQTKPKESKKKKKKKSAAAQATMQSARQQTMQSATGLSMRSSLDMDEFADARDDLDLKL